MNQAGASEAMLSTTMLSEASMNPGRLSPVRWTTRRGRRTPQERDRGSASIWVVTAAFAMTLLVGLAVDLGGQVHAQQQARDVAAQAARVAGQQVAAPAAIRGTATTVDAAAARTAAQQYLAAAGVTGTATVRGGTTITVHVTDTYPTRFLSLIGIGTLHVDGTATARLIRTLGGTEQ